MTENMDGNSWWVVLLFLFAFMGGGFGGNRYGTGEFGTYATAASQNEVLLGQKFDTISRQIGAIGDGLCSTTYELAEKINGVNANTTAQTQKILDALAQNKIDELQAKVSALEMQNAMAGIVRYPMATTYNSGGNPFCGCNCG